MPSCGIGKLISWQAFQGILCGAIRYETVGEPVFTLRCHCRDCQRQSGSAHVPAARIPSAGFRILQGIPKRSVTKADSGNDVAASSAATVARHCTCRSGLARTSSDFASAPFKPDADIFMKSAQLWDHDQPDVPKHETYPPGQSYPTVPSGDR